MPPYDKIYGRKCRSPMCWEEVGERALAERELVEVINQVMPFIRARLKIATSKHKSYANLHRREVVFKEGDMVLLKVISEPDLKILEDLSYIEQPIQIIDTQIRKLRNKEIPKVKALWNRHNMEKCMWEIHDSMIQQYPHLF
ncbi:uncharacterized protein LOC131173831 [Hevea brasiliensis]|uniref:uncharacterized protein LOC131173831 n=1 Tax=Hevea brasiliensis TaxID=3981 RepID=UPI0025E051AF|nr:uncharacterized protein LOC131173831 [Hevea brasiliensis]